MVLKAVFLTFCRARSLEGDLLQRLAISKTISLVQICGAEGNLKDIGLNRKC